MNKVHLEKLIFPMDFKVRGQGVCSQLRLENTSETVGIKARISGHGLGTGISHHSANSRAGPVLAPLTPRVGKDRPKNSVCGKKPIFKPAPGGSLLPLGLKSCYPHVYYYAAV